MVAFGLVLVVLSGLLSVGVLLSNTDPVMASAFGLSLSHVTLGEFFVLGTGVGLVFALGLTVAAAGARRRRAKRRGLKDQVLVQRSERELLEEQNTLLREQLERGHHDELPPLASPEPAVAVPVAPAEPVPAATPIDHGHDLFDQRPTDDSPH